MKQIQYKTTDKINKEVIDEILRVEETKGLNAENLLDIAKDKMNPLHDLFEWDNSSAGKKYRLQQARILINEVKIIVDNKERYAFENIKISVNTEEETPENITSRIYKPIGEIMDKEEYRKQVLLSALSNMNYWKDKYAEYNELKLIFVSLDKVKKNLDKKWIKKKQ